MALSFSEKRGHQKVVDENLSTLEGGGLAFAAKRTAQKAMNDSLDKLDAGNDPVQPEAVNPTVDEVGAVLESRGWKLSGNLDGGAWQLDPSVPTFVGKGSYLVTGVDAGGGNSGWITLDTFEDGVWSGLGRTIDIKNNTANGIVKEIESRIAEKEEQNPEPTTPPNQKLTDLLSGKYDDLQPEAYQKMVQDIITEINDIDPVKPALVSYLDKAKSKGLITEAAMAAIEATLNQ